MRNLLILAALLVSFPAFADTTTISPNGTMAGDRYVLAPWDSTIPDPIPVVEWVNADTTPYWNFIAKPRVQGTDFDAYITSLVQTATSRTFNNPTRSLNTCFQISSSKDTLVSYAVDIAATLSLTSGQTGTVFLEYSDNNTCSTNTVEVNRTANGNTGTLTIGLNLTQTTTGTLSGVIPAGKYVQIRTANTAGTPTFTYRRAQEVLL